MRMGTGVILAHNRLRSTPASQSVMYALKARDKLHKLEKDAGKEKQKEALRRARDQDAYHRGREAPHDSQAAPCRPTAARRDAKVIFFISVRA